MTTEENARAIRRIYDELWNERKLEVADDVIAEGATNYDTGLLPMPFDPEEMKGTVRMVTAAFPDNRHEVEEIIAEADTVVLRCTLTGTHEGPFMGIPPRAGRSRSPRYTSTASRKARPWSTGSAATTSGRCASSA